MLNAAVLFGRDFGHSTARTDVLADCVAVTAAIGQQHFGIDFVPRPSDRDRRCCRGLPRVLEGDYWRCTKFQLPSSSGRSRQGAPVRAIQKMASSVRRWSRGGRPHSGPPLSRTARRTPIRHRSNALGSPLISHMKIRVESHRAASGGIPFVRFVHAAWRHAVVAIRLIARQRRKVPSDEHSAPYLDVRGRGEYRLSRRSRGNSAKVHQ